MATWFEDKPEWLNESISSITSQTIRPFEFIILIDGPIPELNLKTIQNHALKYDFIRIVKIKNNCGCFNARNKGIKIAAGDFIAIMDADDISMPYRLEVQMQDLHKYKADIVFSTQNEFYDKSNIFAGYKSCPRYHEDIVKKITFRNLLPDPSIFAKSQVLKKNPYELIKFGSDHKLFLKLALDGYRFYCIQKPLIKVRITYDQRQRRGGGIHQISEDVKLRIWMKRNNLINFTQFLLYSFVFIVFRIIPPSFKDFIYKYILR